MLTGVVVNDAREVSSGGMVKGLGLLTSIQ